MIKRNISLIFLTLFFSGCEDHTANSNQQNSPSLPQLPEITINQKSSEHAKQVALALQASKAKLASKTSDVCPKLVEFEINSQSLTRKNEKLSKYGCKYYVYPDVGKFLEISLDNDTLDATVIKPEVFNFIDGKYKVVSNEKHVIEIKYKRHHGDRMPKTYQVTISQKG